MGGGEGFDGGDVTDDRWQIGFGKPPPPELLKHMPTSQANLPGDGGNPAIGE